MRSRLATMSPPGATTTIPQGLDFPSQRRERIDWQQLASTDLHDLSQSCSMEMLQENLTHVTFCDAEAELDLGTTADQRNLLKLFRLAQLIIQYLFLSQEFMEAKLKEAQEEVQHFTGKYQEVKEKLIQQVEEARKMKVANRNIREKVKYINTSGLSSGIFEAFHCTLCPKTFRGQEFLQSHLWRKHPGQASSIPLPTVPIPAPTSAPIPATAIPLSVAPKTQSHEVPPCSIENPLLSAPTVPSQRTNDVDSHRLNEMEAKFDAMNRNFTRILEEMEEQKLSLEKESKLRQEEIKKAWEEKSTMELNYEAQLKQLNEQIIHLQNVKRDQTVIPDNMEKILQHIQRQNEEIQLLRTQIINQGEMSKVEELVPKNDEVDGLSAELSALRKQFQQQQKKHKNSLKEMHDSLQRNYEESLQTEKAKLQEIIKDIAKKEASTIAQVSQKPPPSPKKLPLKPTTPNTSTKPTIVQAYERQATSSGSTLRVTSKLQSMDTQGSESGSESETDTSYWDQSNLKIQHLHNSSPNLDDEESHNPVITRIMNGQVNNSGTSSSESSDREKSSSEDDESSESLNLDTLLRENPHLWSQMREATADVLASKLSSLGISLQSQGIKSEVLASCLSHLRKDRRGLQRKHEKFLDLRKRIENEVRAKLDDKIDKVDDMSGVQPLSESPNSSKAKHYGPLSRMVKNVHSRVKKQSRALSTSVSKTSESVRSGVKDMFLASSSNDLRREGSLSTDANKRSEETIEDDNSGSEEEEEEGSEDSSSAHIEVHNETLNSVTRNLFSDKKPITREPQNKVKKESYFENKTYGQVQDVSDSEWDSEPEYENVGKTEPPKRTDSLNVSLESADVYQSARNSWDSAEPYKPVKLKKPSGEMVSGLTKTIEQQLSGRHKSKPVGAVDVMGGEAARLERKNTADTHFGSTSQLSESSNTVASSMWGSAERVDSRYHRSPQPSTSRPRLHSWDSEEDLNISDIE